MCNWFLNVIQELKECSRIICCIPLLSIFRRITKDIILFIEPNNFTSKATKKEEFYFETSFILLIKKLSLRRRFFRFDPFHLVRFWIVGQFVSNSAPAHHFNYLVELYLCPSDLGAPATLHLKQLHQTWMMNQIFP